MLLSSNDDYWRVLKGATRQNEGANTRRIFALWLCILRQVFIVRASKIPILTHSPATSSMNDAREFEKYIIHSQE